MNKVLWIVIAVLVIGGIGAIGLAARNYFREAAQPQLLAVSPAFSAAPATTAPAAMAEAAQYHAITPDEAKARMDSQEAVVIVDVRTQAEYDAGHIPGAILVVNEQIGSAMPEALPDKDAQLLVYCRSGRRSRDAAMKLIKLGYTRVYDFGGILDWPYEIQ
jgi:phage shock protein E